MIEHEPVILTEKTKGTLTYPERTVYRATCICGWRAPLRDDTREDALHRARSKHGVMGEGVVQYGMPI